MSFSSRWLVLTLLFFISACGGGGGGGNGPSQPQNTAPVANAGADILVEETAQVILDGSASSDSDGDSLTFNWVQVSGVSVVLSDASAETSNFQAPELLANETLVFNLTVSDGQTSNTDTIQITVNADNDSPTANAGSDIAVEEEGGGQLDGSASFDPENQMLSYAWLQVSGPVVVLSDANSSQPTFTIGNYINDTAIEFQLTVSDGTNTSAIDSITINVTADDDVPVAEAGDDFNSLVDEFVSLDCSASSDPEDSVISYSWRQISGAELVLSDPTSCNPEMLLPKKQGVFEFGLVVNDGVSDSVEDTVAITSRIYSGDEAPIYGNPAQIEKTIELNDSSTSADIVVSGDYLFVRHVSDDFLTRGIKIFSIVDPLNPALLGTINDELPHSMEVVGDLIYYTHGSGMSVASIADPASPQVLDSVSFNGDGVTSIAVNGSLVACTDADGNFYLLNAADPNNILPIDFFPIDEAIDGDQGRGVLFSGDKIYIVYASNTSGLRLAIVDIVVFQSVIIDVQVLSKLNLNAMYRYQTPLAIDTNQLFIGGNGQLISVDVTNPVFPVLNPYRYGQLNEITAFDLDPVNDILIVGDSGVGVTMLDVADLNNIKPLGVYSVNSYINGVAWVNDKILASSFYRNQSRQFLHSIPSIPNASQLAVSSRFSQTGNLIDMATSDGHVFVAGLFSPNGYEVQSIDYSVVDTPVLQDSESLPTHPADISLVGNQLAVTSNAIGSSYLSLFDISDPNDLVVGDNISLLDGTERWGQVTLQDNVAFVSKSSEPSGSFIGVESFNISDIGNINRLGNFNGPATHSFYPPIQTIGNYLYGADQILDISDPANISTFGNFRLGEDSTSIIDTENFISKNKLFVTTYFGVDILDVENPLSPQRVAEIDTLWLPKDITMINDLLVVDDRGLSVRVYDYSGESGLRFTGQFNTITHDLAVDNNGLQSAIQAMDSMGDYAMIMGRQNIIAINPDTPIQHHNYGITAINSALTYALSWEPSNYTVNHADCFVSGGTCVISSVDYNTQQADVIWTLPSEEVGEFEIVFSVGDRTHYLMSSDRVVVE